MTSRLPFLSFRLLNEKNTANYGDSAALQLNRKIFQFCKKEKKQWSVWRLEWNIYVLTDSFYTGNSILIAGMIFLIFDLKHRLTHRFIRIKEPIFSSFQIFEIYMVVKQSFCITSQWWIYRSFASNHSQFSVHWLFQCSIV